MFISKPHMPDFSPYRDAVMMFAGAFVSGTVGLFFARIQKRRDAVLGFRVSLSELDAALKTDNFHHKSCDSIEASLSRIRPFLKPLVYAECVGILRDYKQVPQAEMNRQSLQSLEYDTAHGIDTDQRFSFFVHRFEKALA